MNGKRRDEERERIRRMVLRRRREPAAEWAAATGRAVQERALALPVWAAAKVVGCYLAMPGEVATELIIRRSRAGGKAVCVPACDCPPGTYLLVRLLESSNLVAGPMGVLQPENGAPVATGEVDCFFVPGLAFDKRGTRLGHGGGHFDRILAGAAPGAVKVGLAFGFQIYEHIPAERHDVPMDFVVCEDRTIACAAGSS